MLLLHLGLSPAIVCSGGDQLCLAVPGLGEISKVIVDGAAKRKLLVKPSPASTAGTSILMPSEAPVPSLLPLHQGESMGM